MDGARLSLWFFFLSKVKQKLSHKRDLIGLQSKKQFLLYCAARVDGSFNKVFHFMAHNLL
jgi:hypothetical protein